MLAIYFNIWSVFILLGATQGLFLSGYLFLKRENRKANKWLAFLLAVISLHLLEYSAAITGLTLKYPFLLAASYPLLFCIGPLYYIYCRFLIDPTYHVALKSGLHFLPAFLVLFLMIPFYSMSPEEKITSIQQLADGDSLKIPFEQLVFMATHVGQTVIYILAGYKFLKKAEKKLMNFSSDVFVIKRVDWLNTFSLFFSIYFLLYFLLVVVLTFINEYQIQIDYIMLLITSFSIYAIGYTAISNPDIFKALPNLELRLYKEVNEIHQVGLRVINKFPELKAKLLQYMDTNKPYLKSDLKISELADALAIQYYQLSQLINEEFLVNFYDFINKYRVEEAKKLLVADSRNYKILAIAYEVGFNSKATFNRVFKKFTDLTPSEYKEKFSPKIR